VGTPVNVALYDSIRFNLKKLLRNVDAFSMAYSVESRQPFMDYRLIEFLNAVPACYKMKNGFTKYLARVAFSGKLNDEIVWRKDKLGWPQPLTYWLSKVIETEVRTTVQKSDFVRQIVGVVGDKETSLLKRNSKVYLRLYNVARVHEIFFRDGYKSLSAG
jgi:asparagine synthase (glutamine-hydrolysing)